MKTISRFIFSRKINAGVCHGIGARVSKHRIVPERIPCCTEGPRDVWELVQDHLCVTFLTQLMFCRYLGHVFHIKETGSISLRSQPWNLFKKSLSSFFFFCLLLFFFFTQWNSATNASGFSVKPFRPLWQSATCSVFYLFFFPAWNIHQPMSGLIYDVIPSAYLHCWHNSRKWATRRSYKVVLDQTFDKITDGRSIWTLLVWIKSLRTRKPKNIKELKNVKKGPRSSTCVFNRVRNASVICLFSFFSPCFKRYLVNAVQHYALAIW